MKISEKNFSSLSLFIIFISLAIGAAWNTSYFVVDGITFKLNIILPILCLLSLVFLFVEAKKSPQKITFSYLQIFLLIFFILGSISFFWAEDKSLFFEKWIKIYVGLFVFYVSSKITHNEDSFLKISFILSISAFLVSLIGISQYLYSFPDFKLLQYNNIPASTFGNKNGANQFLVFLYPFIIYLTFWVKENFFRFVGTLSLIFMLTYMYFSVTKAAWIAIFAQTIAIFLFLFFKRVKPFIDKHLFVNLFISFAIVFSLSYFSNQKISINTIDKALTTVNERIGNFDSPRYEIWRSLPSIIEEAPILGHGLGNYINTSVNQGIHQKLQRAHNDLFELVIELGFVGLLIFLIFAFIIIKNTFQVIKNDKTGSFFYVLAFVSLLGSFIHMMVSWPYQTIYGFIAASLMLSILSKESKNHLNKYLELKINSKFFFLIFCFFSLVTFAFASYKSKLWSDALSNFYLNSGIANTKLDIDILKKVSPNLLRRDLNILTIAGKHFEDEKTSDAEKIYTLSTNNSSLANYRRIIFLLEKKRLSEGESLLRKMQSKSKNNPLTFAATMSYYRATGDLESAKKTYLNYKKYILSRFSFDFRAYLYLHQWSISLQFYEDTEGYYEKLISKWKIADHVETKMVNYYVYKGQYKKALPHLKYVLEKNPEIIDPLVLKALIDKGYVKLKNDSKS